MLLFRNLSIQVKVILATSTLFFISFVGLSLYQYENSKKELINSVLEKELPATADKIGQVIQNKLDIGSTLTSSITNNTYLKQWIMTGESDVDEIAIYLDELKAKLGARYVGVASDKSMNLYNEKGVLREINSQDSRSKWYFKMKSSTEDVSFGTGFLDNNSDKLVFWFNEKIKDQEGNFLGIGWSGYAINELNSLVGSLKVGNEGSVYIIDETGYIKVHKDSDLVQRDGDIDPSKNINSLPGISKHSSMILDSLQRHLTFMRHGKKFHAMASFIPQVNWFTIVEVSEGELIEPLSQNLKSTLQIGLAVLLLTIIISVLLVRKAVITPLLNFQRGLLQFFNFLNRKTDQIELIDHKNNDEVGLMVRAVNDNIKRIESGIAKDNNIISEVSSALKTIKEGKLDTRLEGDAFNPELCRLKDNFNQMIEILERKVGHDINDILSLMKSYGDMDFSNSLKYQDGEMEKQVILMGKKIADSIDEINKAEKKIRKQANDLKLSKEKAESALEELQTTQTQMVQSEKMATLGQLVAGIAHEINSPLGAINASSDLIVSAIKKSSELFPDLVNNLKPSHFQAFAQLMKGDYAGIMPASREVRRLRKSVISTLGDLGCKHPDEIGHLLIEMNIYEIHEDIIPLLTDDNAKSIIESASKLFLIRSSNENIRNAVMRATKILFALKNYSHRDIDGEKTETDLKENLETVLTIYYSNMKYAVEVVKNFEDVPKIKAYSDELNQVWTNLLHNSLQAMQYKGTLEFGIHRKNGMVEVSIKDSGGGIPKDIQDKVFTPFFTTKSQGEGTGLGLDIVRKIVDKHEGKISFECEEGIGTTFKVLLPLN